MGTWFMCSDPPFQQCRCAITTGRFRCGAPQHRATPYTRRDALARLICDDWGPDFEIWDLLSDDDRAGYYETADTALKLLEIYR